MTNISEYLEENHFKIHEISSELTDSLNKIDYNYIRKLLTKIGPAEGHSFFVDDWDIPPVNIQRAINAFKTSQEVFNIVSESKLVEVLIKNSDFFKEIISKETIPDFDKYLLKERHIDYLITLVRNHNLFSSLSDMEIKKYLTSRIDEYELAEKLRVELNSSVRWDERIILKDEVSKNKRKKYLANIGKGVIGGVLALGNISLGVIAGSSLTIPGINGASIPIAIGIANSTYTGLNGLMDSFKAIADDIKKESTT